MPIHFWGDLLTTLGDVIIALTVLAVIERLREQKHVDRRVIGMMRLEKIGGIFGILMVILGMLIKYLGGHYG